MQNDDIWKHDLRYRRILNVWCLCFPEAPVEVVVPLQNQECIENDTVSFTCTLSKPFDKCRWLKDGKDIMKSDGFVMTSDGVTQTLTIPKAALDHEAEYTIVAQKARSSAMLMVEGTLKSTIMMDTSRSMFYFRSLLFFVMFPVSACDTLPVNILAYFLYVSTCIL